VFVVTLVKPVHPWNAFAPTVRTDDGIVMLVKPVQLRNALETILVTL
jgi:hypothetical protein